MLFALAGMGDMFGQVTISYFSPGFGTTNDQVSIVGSGFYPGTVIVKYNGAQDSTAQATSATLIQSKVPPGATTGRISVQVGSSSATSLTNFVVIGAGPYVTSFTPVIGSATTTVYLNGVHFTYVTNAYFAGQPASGSVISDTLISLTAPAGVVSGPLTLRSPLGNYTTISNFDVPPVITSFSPTAGRAGTNIIISGTNFLDAFAVSFGGAGGAFTVPATFNVLSNRAISVQVPANATSGKIRVDAPAGSVDSANTFTLQPVIYGFTPGFGPAGSSVTITGANFNASTPAVKFNGTAASLSGSVSFGQVTALVPSGGSSGPITLSTSDGTATSLQSFLYPASITGITPNKSPPGTWVALTGNNFLGATAVSFNGLPASFQFTNNTVLGAVVPYGVISGPVSVTTPANTATSSALFYGAPVITGFAPAHGAANTTVTISGTNFLGATAVQFNGLNGTILTSTNGQISARVPSGASSGPLTVVAPAGSAVSAGTFIVDYPSDLAVWGTAAPSPATLGSNLVYTISLINYGPNTAPNTMMTNTLPGSVTLKSATVTQGTLTSTGNLITGAIGSMNNGAAITLTITVVPNALGNITNLMSIGSDSPDPNLNNNTASIATLVQSPAWLSIQALTNKIKVSWPSDLSNYVLQARNLVLTNTFWSNVTATATISGNQKSVIEGNTNSARLYRLAD